MTEQEDVVYLVQVTFDEPDGGRDEIIGYYSSKEKADEVAESYRNLLKVHEDYHLNDRFGFAYGSYQFRVYVFPVSSNSNPALPVRLYMALVSPSLEMTEIMRNHELEGITPVLVHPDTLEPFMFWYPNGELPSSDVLREAVGNPERVVETEIKVEFWHLPKEQEEKHSGSHTLPLLVSRNKAAIVDEFDKRRK